MSDETPVAEPADPIAALIHEYAVIRGDLSEQYARDQLRDKIAELLVRRDEKRDREAVGRVVERVEAVLAVEGGPDGPDVSCAGYSVDDSGCFVNDLAQRIRKALAEIEGA